MSVDVRHGKARVANVSTRFVHSLSTGLVRNVEGLRGSDLGGPEGTWVLSTHARVTEAIRLLLLWGVCAWSSKMYPGFP